MVTSVSKEIRQNAVVITTVFCPSFFETDVTYVVDTTNIKSLKIIRIVTVPPDLFFTDFDCQKKVIQQAFIYIFAEIKNNYYKKPNFVETFRYSHMAKA